jgi:hypothetical protein
VDFHAVRQLDVLNRREVERRGLRKGRDRTDRLGGRDVGLALGLTACRRLDVGRAIAGLQPHVEGRAAQPLLHGRLDLLRRRGRILLQCALVEVAVAGIDLALGQRDGLAAEAADLLQPADPPGHVAGGGAAHLVLGRAIGQELGQDLVEASVDHRRIDAGLDGDVDLELADSMERLQPGADRDGQLFVPHQDVVQPRAGKPAKDRAAQVKSRKLVGQQARHRPVALQLRRRDAILHHNRLGRGQRRHVRRRGHVHRTALDCAEILLDQWPGLGRVDIARQHQHRVVGTIIVEEPALHVCQAGGAEVGHRADGAVMIWVTFWE